MLILNLWCLQLDVPLYIHIVTVLINNFAVSIASITVTTTPGLTLYESTPIDIMCNVMLSNSVDTSFTITYQWLGPLPITAGPDNTLRINQLTALDNNRNITCMATVTGSQFVAQNTASNSTQLSVQGEY